jgi:hypothetical protein
MVRLWWCLECGRGFHSLRELLHHQDRDRCGIVSLEREIHSVLPYQPR